MDLVRNLFLAGGGTEQDSVLLDKAFASVLDPEKSLLYIPVAMESRPYSACFEWIKKVFAGLGIGRIEMVTDLKSVSNALLKESSGVYLGGGNTQKLLNEIQESGLRKKLVGAIENGLPVYGGSAGAIVLGKTIESSFEVTETIPEKTRGLNMLDGYSVVPHYSSQKGLPKAGFPFLAIPERSGIHIFGQSWCSIGFEASYICDKSGIRALGFKSGELHAELE